MIRDKHYLRYYNILIFLIIIIPIIAIIFPYKNPILFSFILSFMLYPLYKLIKKIVKSRHISAYIVLIILIFLVMLPFGIMYQKISTDVQLFYKSTKEKIENDEQTISVTNSENSNPFTYLFSMMESKFNINENYLKLIENIYNKMGNVLFEKSSGFVFTIPSVLLDIFIILFITFYLLVDGNKFIAQIEKIFPFPPKHKVEINRKFKHLISGVLYGQIMIALIQGAVAGFAYLLVGVDSALFWGLMTAIFAILPVFGTAIIWFPMATIMIINGLLIQQDNLLLGKGIGLMIFGIFVISTVDNFLKPKLVSNKTDEHPAIILIGIIGGIYIFGMGGIFIGPVLLSSCLLIFKLYVRELYGIEDKNDENKDRKDISSVNA